MKISIITAVYNNKLQISSAIQSVINQTYTDIEYIVIDGNSTDGTKEIVQSYGNQISTFISESDSGIYEALNKGIKRATGDVIGFLHSDDVFENEYVVENIANAFTDNTISGTYGNLVYVHKDDAQKVIRYWQSNAFSSSMLRKGWMPPHPTLFLKRELYTTYGLFDTNYKIAADYDFMLRVLSKPDLHFVYLPQIITRMRVGGASNKSIKNIIRKSKEDYLALKHNKIGGLYALFVKNFSKIGQFFKKQKSD